MTPTLDDLLPQSDATYEPPVNPGDLFTDNSALFELADEFKYTLTSQHDRASFSYGYYAAVFDVWLKTGLGFWMPVPIHCVDGLVERAERFNRKVDVTYHEKCSPHVTVHAHGESK